MSSFRDADAPEGRHRRRSEEGSSRGGREEGAGETSRDSGGSREKPGGPVLPRLRSFFRRRGWEPFPFQEQLWEAQLQGKSGLLQVATGSGKTYAVALVPLVAAGLEEERNGIAPGVRLLYVTPLRALARDITRSLREAAEELAPKLRVEMRTGDTPESLKRRQRSRLPEVLVTTPESLSLLLSHRESEAGLRKVRYLVLDEWHELLSGKRGVQAELASRHLEAVGSGVVTWALSATLGNMEEAAAAALGTNREPFALRGELKREVRLETIAPEAVTELPWAGHLGLGMVHKLLERLDRERSTLIFTNTRNQAERWYQEIFQRLGPEAPPMALHHGSIEGERRREVEEGVRAGTIRWVVATSSLDLGVDFYPVETVVQIGSPKGIDRLLQRAGRSGHRPGAPSRLIFLPTNALELLELEAMGEALLAGEVEPRRPLEAPMDLLAQHMVTLAAGPGFEAETLFREVTSCHAFRKMEREQFDELLAFVTSGGTTLKGYPEYRRVEYDGDRYRVADEGVARRHRAAIGTITSRGMVRLRFTNRRELGLIEESFASKLRKGDTFFFAGRSLEFVMIREGTAYVRGSRARESVPMATWVGSGLPYSQVLGRRLRELLSRPPETGYLGELLALQHRRSALPKPGQLLIEFLSTSEGEHLFLYPFEGESLHESLGALLAHRISKRRAITVTVTANDHGLELRAPKETPFREAFTVELFSAAGVEQELREAVNLGEISRRRFRGIAQIAGLVFPGYPGEPRRRRELQASASLFYDLFRNHEPHHILLRQAERESLEGELLLPQLLRSLEQMRNSELLMRELPRPSPFCFPLMVKNLAARLSSESLARRVARLSRRWSPGASEKEPEP
jgi:ATP-dependent Lhr-like helicase